MRYINYDFVDVFLCLLGWHLRERLLSEMPSLRPQALEGSNGSPDFSGGGCGGSGHTFVFVDGSCSASKVYADLFSMGSLSHDTAEAITPDTSASSAAVMRMKKSILTHIIELDFCIRESTDEEEVEKTDPLCLDDKENSQVDTWYSTAMSICSRAKSLPCDSDATATKSDNPAHLPPGGLAKLFREANLSDLIDEISPGMSYWARRAPIFDKSAIPAAAVRMSTTILPGAAQGATASPPASAPSSPPSAAKRFLEGDDDEMLPAFEGEEDSSAELLIPEPALAFGEYSPAVPAVQFSAFEFSPDVLSAPSAAKRISVPLDNKALRYLHDVMDTSALRQLICSQRTSIANSDGQLAKCGGSVIVKIMLIGGNFVVHKFLCALISLASKEKSIFENIKFDIYVVPCARNDIATYLARSDKWYRRHVFYPFIGPVGLCPQLDFTQEAENIKAAAQHSLSISMRCQQSLLETFVRQANETVETCVFECLCWSEYCADRTSRADGGATEGPSVCIPFVSSLELGVFVQATMYKRQIQAAAQPSADSHQPCLDIPSYAEDSGELKVCTCLDTNNIHSFYFHLLYHVCLLTSLYPLVPFYTF
jgi:hypothetical protein